MSDRILQLCKRLNKFTLDKIVTISEIPEDKLLPVLNKLIIENKLSLENNIYSYKKKQKVSDKYSIFKYYPKATIDTIIKCFCVAIIPQLSQELNITKIPPHLTTLLF